MNLTRHRSNSAAFCRTSLLLACAYFILSNPVSAQRAGGFDNGYVRSNYNKFEYQIPMRDGIKLFTSVYVPRDTNQPFPILLQRTPYGVAPYGSTNYRASLGPSYAFTTEGFIFAYQDVRGRGHSDGVFDDPPAHKLHFAGPADTDESTDSYDTIDWLVKNIREQQWPRRHLGHLLPGFLLRLYAD